MGRPISLAAVVSTVFVECFRMPNAGASGFWLLHWNVFDECGGNNCSYSLLPTHESLKPEHGVDSRSSSALDVQSVDVPVTRNVT